MNLVCISFRGNFPLRHADQEFDRIMQGVEFNATVHTDAGSEVELSNPMRAWSKYGELEKKDELAACLHLNCKKEKLSIGTIITAIDIAANKPINVQGIYWNSTNRWDYFS